MWSYIISFIAPLAYFLFLTAFLVCLTKRSFGKCLVLGMMLSAFLLFFSQLIFGTFMVGFVIGVICAVAAIPLGVIKRKDFSKFKELYFTSGFVVFLVLYIVVYIYDLNRGFSRWDELSHWGMMVKEMVRLDKFYFAKESNLLVHKDYPPIMGLFETFWLKLCGGGGFNEACVARALHTFELALLAPFIAEKVAEKKNFWKSVAVGVVAIVIITLIILFFDGHRVFGTIYVDYVMALLVVFLLMTILAPKRIGWFEILMIMVGGSFLLLLKQMGAPLYMMVICFLFGMLWLRKKQKLKEYLTSVGWKRVGLVLMMLLIPFVLWFVWNKMVDGQVQQFKLSDLNLAEFIKVLVGHGEPWQAETVNNYIAALGGSSITTSYIKISFLPTIALFVGGMWLVLRLSRKSLDGKEMVLAMVVILVGAIGYVVMMLLLYVLSFGEVEGPTLASYDRYMGTYAILMMVFVAMIVIWQGAIKSKRGLICVLTLIMILINLSNVNMYGLVFPDLRGRIFGSYTKYEEEAKRITNMVGDEAKVYLLMGEKSLAYGYEFFVQYYGNTIKFNYNNMDMVKYYGEEILSEIKNSDYLLVVEAEKSLEDKYCDELKVCPLGVGNMYKVLKKEDNTFKYELIGNIYNIDD